MNNIKYYFFLAFISIATLGCDTNNLADLNVSMPKRNWSYVNKVKASVEIKDHSKPHTVYFKLRHTADYRYSNIFVLLHVKAPGQKKTTRRFEYKLAESDGQWLGSGSGNLFTYKLNMLTNYRFPANGVYEFEIEQNMRDNPLKEVSDAGITVSY
jgi:gliding motility-associated lipoprotein GldH|eukprot:TRINITY_DN4185_c0_g1_i1.p1 TRINITY_DN4185_c0_g1~~TRINITY_DN4185_c0_g1_i1.p1  ORF type:complete len:155 (-),score=16.03 TRINITY_DN4185_c0_g1_i1:74-538(-)